ncbi:bifunctional glycosyl transferase/transpeptidase [Blochmannia endosymbiont of Camponotus sp.]|uniref:bifunctional glycosyl transferase/transpeptidase n=1 Tax=Blochmannia endosymbiont of Camponotus sp. TaxID=700220 RepID=UPI0020258047|nr:bifunctional glycosyl transferase/transpeptidase [Blochmannia endosymbiont of Camponotus sp.]URJ24076.1 bifunctional glycosyl transferase/transpeptidase [Blochmannia endosymbiont of Camponotus sp.]
MNQLPHKYHSAIVQRTLCFLYTVTCVFLFIIILIIVYGIFLDKKVQRRINGKVWRLPTIIYSRMINVEPNMAYNKNDIINLLEALQYRQVSKITHSGEFVVHNNDIELFRRSFNFPSGEEGEIHVSFFFNQEKLLRIYNQDTKNNFGVFRFDPKIISILYAPNKQQRLFIPRSGFPDILIDMLLAVEDRYFYQHDGIQISSIGRAFLANVFSGRTVQGGSTLTQQLVKNLFLNNTRSLWRKFNEAYMALLFDHRYSKDRILELYLNEIYFGQNGNDQIHGFPLASFYYFGRPVNELSIDQQAMLVGMIKGASLYNPWKNPHITLERRNLILKMLEHRNIIDKKICAILSARPLGTQAKNAILIIQPAFTQMVNEEIQNIDQINDFSGIKIFTTLDPISQKAAEQAMELGIHKLRHDYNMKDLEGAIVVVDRFSGKIRAMVGGSDPHFYGFNRAMHARRSIGSLAKPAIYLAALSYPNKYHLNTWIADEPIHLQQPNGVIWSPKNYDRKFRGKVTLIDAFIKSLNVPTVNLGMTIGLDAISDVLKTLGISPDFISSFPSILLGSISLTPVEVAQKFQTIASGGQYSALSSICYIMNEEDIVLYQHFTKTERVIFPQAAYLTLYAMQQVVTRGTSCILSLKFPCSQLAAKTGTTNDFRDSWFVGIDDTEVTVIWIGRDNNGRTKLTGTNGALTLYNLYLDHKNPTPLHLEPPSGIQNVAIDNCGNFTLHDSNKNTGCQVFPVWVDDWQLLFQSLKESKTISYNQQLINTVEERGTYNTNE